LGQAEWSYDHFEVQIFFADLDPKAVRVEPYADGVGTSPQVRQQMQCAAPLVGSPGGYLYRAAASTVRPPTDYTPRVIPHFDGAAVTLEAVRAGHDDHRNALDGNVLQKTPVLALA
jgi:starch phosphorylase